MQEASNVLYKAEALSDAIVAINQPSLMGKVTNLGKSLFGTVSSYIPTFGYGSSGGASTVTEKEGDVEAIPIEQLQIHKGDAKRTAPAYPNAQMRALVISAEANLLISQLILMQESMVSYVKAGIRMRKGKDKLSLLL
jgi:hypothetical protein